MMSLFDEGLEESIAICRNCGTTVDPTGGIFCPTCGWNNDDRPTESENTSVGEISCPACWAPNPGTNRHCEQCAARLGNFAALRPPNQERPRIRVAGGVLAGTIAVVVAFVVISNGARERDASATPEAPQPTVEDSAAIAEAVEEAPPTAPPPGPIQPESVDVSSEFSLEFGSSALLDGDLSTAWNDASLHGDGATLTFRFATPVILDEITITNLADPDRFVRNFRLRGYAISLDGEQTAIAGELDDVQQPQTIALGNRSASVVTLAVTSTYGAQSTDAGPPFEELAIAEVGFIGR